MTIGALMFPGEAAQEDGVVLVDRGQGMPDGRARIGLLLLDVAGDRRALAFGVWICRLDPVHIARELLGDHLGQPLRPGVSPDRTDGMARSSGQM